MKRVLAIGALLLALTGCGTVQNFQRESPARPTPYGGVDIAADRYKTHPEIPGALIYSDAACAADVALSAVGDTLTLPITLTLEAWHIGSVLWYLAFEYDNTPPPSNPWHEFWFGNAINDYYFPQNAEQTAPPAP